MARPGAFVVSLDFELHWGVRDLRSVAQYRDNLLGGRAAVPAMLDLFAEHDVAATWAIVGLLFAESKREMLARLPALRPSYRHATLAASAGLDEVGEDERDDPFHFAPSLIRRIAATARQEIGTHSFTHYYCLEDGASPAALRADLEAAIAVTRDKLGGVPRSIVFPRNQYDAEALGVCRALGLTAYRGNPSGWAYRARRGEVESSFRRAVRLADAYLPLTGSHARPVASGAPLDVPASRYLRPWTPMLRRLEPLRLRRIEAEMERAARDGLVFHLWWHPHDFGAHLVENLAVLRRILASFRRLRDTRGMESLAMGDVAGRA
ncbi:MAG TPA: polysaccharide deacetylase family protein [Candidatus Binatia bacterium]|nr:polysaccharide deacetylase family protein [Candidatus Binatia bacterium]